MSTFWFFCIYLTFKKEQGTDTAENNRIRKQYNITPWHYLQKRSSQVNRRTFLQSNIILFLYQHIIWFETLSHFCETLKAKTFFLCTCQFKDFNQAGRKCPAFIFRCSFYYNLCIYVCRCSSFSLYNASFVYLYMKLPSLPYSPVVSQRVCILQCIYLNTKPSIFYSFIEHFIPESKNYCCIF